MSIVAKNIISLRKDARVNVLIVDIKEVTDSSSASPTSTFKASLIAELFLFAF